MVSDNEETIFLKTLFSFHQSKDLATPSNYDVHVLTEDKSASQPTPVLMVSPSPSSTDPLFTEEPISIRKSILGAQSSFEQHLFSAAIAKHTAYSFSAIAKLVADLCRLSPVARDLVLEPLLEKFPHKSTSLENIYAYT